MLREVVEAEEELDWWKPLSWIQICDTVEAISEMNCSRAGKQGRPVSMQKNARIWHPGSTTGTKGWIRPMLGPLGTLLDGRTSITEP